MAFHLPDESAMSAKGFLIYNILIIVLLPFISVLVTAGAYIVALVLGIIAAIAIVILLFIYTGPIVAIIVLIIIGLLLGGGSAAFNAVGNSIEIIASFIAMAIPAIMCLCFGISMVKNAKNFQDTTTRVSAYITAVAYGVGVVMFLITAVRMAADGENGIGYTTLYGVGMFLPSLPRIFYTIFGFIELK